MPGALEPVGHSHIVRCRLMARIDDHYAELEKPRGEEVLHQLAPALALRLRDFGKAIARQVYEIEPAVYEEVIDVYGLAGG